MDDLERKVRLKILQELMDDMDRSSFSRMKEPKVVTVEKVGSNDPELLNELGEEGMKNPEEMLEGSLGGMTGDAMSADCSEEDDDEEMLNKLRALRNF